VCPDGPTFLLPALKRTRTRTRPKHTGFYVARFKKLANQTVPLSAPQPKKAKKPKKGQEEEEEEEEVEEEVEEGVESEVEEADGTMEVASDGDSEGEGAASDSSSSMEMPPPQKKKARNLVKGKGGSKKDPKGFTKGFKGGKGKPHGKGGKGGKGKGKK
jgi:hypothetical protein